jgi:hypothetical protein
MLHPANGVPCAMYQPSRTDSRFRFLQEDVSKEILVLQQLTNRKWIFILIPQTPGGAINLLFLLAPKPP